MKKILLSVLALVLLMGCAARPSSYQYPNKDVAIVSVDLLLNENELHAGINESEMRLVRTLEPNEISPFMNDVYGIPTDIVGTPPPWGYGYYVVKVTYENGDIEFYGSLNIEFVSSGNSPTGIGDYYFTGDEFEKLYTQYATANDKALDN